MNAACESTIAVPSAVRETGTGFVMPPLIVGRSALDVAAGASLPWVWQGLLAPGAITLLTSQWKAGKTTLASVLLARLRTGGHVAGLPLHPGKAVVVTEEGPQHWSRRAHQLDLGDHIGWFCRPFKGKPRPAEWTAFLDGLLDLHARFDYSLLLIDPLAAFLPGGGENHAGCMLEALSPLQRLTAAGVCVWILHHPRKNDPAVGHAARGSGALSGHVDIVMEMRTYQNADDDDRRRRLWTFSRYPETPRQLVIEWTPDGKDYIGRGTFVDEEFTRYLELLRAILAEADKKLDRGEIRSQWPDEHAPDKVTLIRWLERAVEKGLVKKDGRGRRQHPFRYWLPEREEVWRKDPLATLFMPELFQGPGDIAPANTR